MWYLDVKALSQTHLNLTGTSYESGALFSYDGNPEQVIIRVGICVSRLGLCQC